MPVFAFARGWWCACNREREKASALTFSCGFLVLALLVFGVFLKIYLLIDWLIAMLGLCFCSRASSSCGKRGPLFIAVRGPLTIAASLVGEHRLQTRRLSSCGSRAQLFRGMWDLPRPGLEPVSPALAGRFSTTAPPGKPALLVLTSIYSFVAEIFLRHVFILCVLT